MERKQETMKYFKKATMAWPFRSIMTDLSCRVYHDL